MSIELALPGTHMQHNIKTIVDCLSRPKGNITYQYQRSDKSSTPTRQRTNARNTTRRSDPLYSLRVNHDSQNQATKYTTKGFLHIYPFLVPCLS